MSLRHPVVSRNVFSGMSVCECLSERESERKGERVTKRKRESARV